MSCSMPGFELRPGLVLAGVDDLTNNHAASDAGTSLAKALAGRPPGATVLLSHVPLPLTASAGRGVDLILSGHTHAGQIWPSAIWSGNDSRCSKGL